MPSKRTKSQRMNDSQIILELHEKGFTFREIADRLNKDRLPKQHISAQSVWAQLQRLLQERDEHFSKNRKLYWVGQLLRLEHLIGITSKELDQQFDTKTLAQLRELHKDYGELLALYRIAEDLADQQSDADREAKTLKIGFVDAS